jgi:hypothetical protein
MNQKICINFTEEEWNEQMANVQKSGDNRKRFSTLFDYVISFKLQKEGINCWFKSK